MGLVQGCGAAKAGTGSPCCSERWPLREDLAGIAAGQDGAARRGYTPQPGPRDVPAASTELGSPQIQPCPFPQLLTEGLREIAVISKERRQGLCCYLWREFLQLLESFKLLFLQKEKGKKTQRERRKKAPYHLAVTLYNMLHFKL